MEATSAPRPLAARLPVPRRVLAALSDERLVEHVRRGDAAAFEILYDRHSRGILAFCRHMLRSANDAEDAVQHTFIAAHNDLQRHDKRELHFRAWLYTIARNRCLSMLRSQREQAADDIEIVSDRMSEDVQQRADLRALLLDIHKLPEEQREALVLSEVGDLTHGEVASVLSCEVSKVKSLVFQARSSLIDRRMARETPCEEIREQISTLRGGALRRSHLRHHLEACPGCSEFREQVRRQRAMLAVALPVMPSAALRGDVLGALGIGGGTATAAATGAVGGLGLAAKGGLAKVGIAAALVGGSAGGATIVNDGSVPLISGEDTAEPAGASSTGGPGNGAGVVAGTSTDSDETRGKERGPENRSESGKAHGFTPSTRESNGARAREFAATRGNGKKTGLSRTERQAAAERRAKRLRRAKTERATPPAAPRPRTEPKASPAPRTRTAPEPAPTPTVTEPTPTTTEPAPTPTTTEPVPVPTPDPGSTSKGGSNQLEVPTG